MAAPHDHRELWLEPWPSVRGVADLGHLAEPSAPLRLLRFLLGRGAARGVVIYDVRRLADLAVGGLVEPCQVLTAAPLAPRTRRAIALVEAVSRLARRPLAVVVYAELSAPPTGFEPVLPP